MIQLQIYPITVMIADGGGVDIRDRRVTAGTHC